MIMDVSEYTVSTIPLHNYHTSSLSQQQRCISGRWCVRISLKTAFVSGILSLVLLGQDV